MLSIDETQEMLGELLDEIPDAFFRGLNGGVSLLPQAKPSPAARANDLYILGEYSISPFLGRAIFLYYGSFAYLFADQSPMRLRRELRHTLRHEFRHHMESLAGENALEAEDFRQMESYLREHGSEEPGGEEGWLKGLRFRRKPPV